MQIKVSKLQKTIDGDVSGAEAVVIFLDKGNIVHEERFTGKTMGENDHPFKRDVKWEGVYDKHQAVLLNGGEFEYELILNEDKDQGMLASLLDLVSDKPKTGIRNSSTKKNADK